MNNNTKAKHKRMKKADRQSLVSQANKRSKQNLLNGGKVAAKGGEFAACNQDLILKLPA